MGAVARALLTHRLIVHIAPCGHQQIEDARRAAQQCGRRHHFAVVGRRHDVRDRVEEVCWPELLVRPVGLS